MGTMKRWGLPEVEDHGLGRDDDTIGRPYIVIISSAIADVLGETQRAWYSSRPLLRRMP